MVVTCYKNYGTPHPTPLESLLHALGSRRHWKIPPAAVCFCRSRGVQIFLGCVLAPQIFRPPTHRCGWRYFIGGFRKMQQVGLWKLKNVALLAVRHQ